MPTPPTDPETLYQILGIDDKSLKMSNRLVHVRTEPLGRHDHGLMWDGATSRVSGIELKLPQVAG